MLTPRRLIITDGSLPALAALALQNRPDHAVLWAPELAGASALQRQAAITRQAEHFGIDPPLGPGAARAASAPSASATRPAALDDAFILVSALRAARELRCGRVIWSCQAGLNLDRIAALHEVAMCAAHLAGLDATTSQPAPEIRTPVIDCTDAQVIDLITASGAPATLAWWCDHDAPQPCGGCEGCRRWERVLRSPLAA